MPLQPKAKCHLPNCSNKVDTSYESYGLCPTCYNAAKTKITAGAGSVRAMQWQQLADMGLCKMPDSRSAFDKAFEEATNKPPMNLPELTQEDVRRETARRRNDR